MRFDLPGQLPEKRVWLLCLAVLTLLYHILFFNRFFPIQEGWFNVYAHYVRSGCVPYRDFYFFLPPLYLLKITALLNIFGDAFITFRIYAVIERILLISLVYAVYLRFARPRTAFLAALLSLFMYAGASVDVIYSYYQTCMLLGVLSLYFLVLALEREGRWQFIALSAAFAGLSFMCKQSTGLFILLAVPAAILVAFRATGLRRSASLLAVYCGFAALSVVPFLLWLGLSGALPPFVSQVFLGGVASKGSLVTMLFGFFKVLFSVKYLFWYLLFAGVVWASSRKAAAHPGEVNESAGPGPLLLLLGAAVAIVVPYLAPAILKVPYLFRAFDYLKEILINSAFIFVLSYSLLRLPAMFSGAAPVKERVAFSVAIFSVAVMYAHGLSYALEPHAALPGFGFGICFIFSLPLLKGRIVKLLTFLSILCFVMLSSGRKYSSPYGWWGWIEPNIRMSAAKLDFPETRGFVVPSYENAVYSDIVKIIKQNSVETDTIYTFPHIPLFYYLSGRYPATFALVHYFDVCPDWLALADRDRLRAELPKVIVSLNFSERTWKFHEAVFRNGAPSGQRALAEFISEVTSPERKLYERSRKYLTPTGESLEVWVRTGRAEIKR